MDKDAKIYVAGHTGLVGSALLRKLKSEGYNNIVTRSKAELDLCRQQAVEEFFAKEKPEYVFLAAAKVGGILANNTYKAEFIYDNLSIACNVIHSSYRYKIKKLINLGSSCIYPKFAAQPIKEEYLLSGALEPTNEPYAVAKIAAIKLCRYYNEQYGTNFISVMPTNLYGPNDNFNLETAHVLPALIRKFYLAKLLQNHEYDEIKKDLQKRSFAFKDDDLSPWEYEQILEKNGISENHLEIWGSGNALREFLYVDDLAHCCIFLMNNISSQDVGECINIGSGQEINIKNLANKIKEVVGFNGSIKFNLSKPDGTPRKLLDSSKMKALGWKPTTDLETGLRQVYAWYREQ